MKRILMIWFFISKIRVLGLLRSDDFENRKTFFEEIKAGDMNLEEAKNKCLN